MITTDDIKMTNFLTKSIPNTHLALGIKNLSLWLEKKQKQASAWTTIKIQLRSLLSLKPNQVYGF